MRGKRNVNHGEADALDTSRWTLLSIDFAFMEKTFSCELMTWYEAVVMSFLTLYFNV